MRLFGEAQNYSGTMGGAPLLGNWTPATAAPLGAVSVTPSTGSGLTKTFSAVYTDPNGASDLEVVYLDFGTSLFAPNSCILVYVPASNALYLFNDASTGVASGSPIKAGTSSTLSNSQCTLSGSGGTPTLAGNYLTAPFALTFAGGFTGSKNIYGMAQNYNGMQSGWPTLGTWNVGGGGSCPTITSFTPTSGSIGTLVTITGSNLVSSSGTASVIVPQQVSGTITVLPTTASATSLAFVIPSGADHGPARRFARGHHHAIRIALHGGSLHRFHHRRHARLHQPVSRAERVLQHPVGEHKRLHAIGPTERHRTPTGVTAQFTPSSMITAGQFVVLNLTAPAGQAVGDLAANGLRGGLDRRLSRNSDRHLTIDRPGPNYLAHRANRCIRLAGDAIGRRHHHDVGPGRKRQHDGLHGARHRFGCGRQLRAH